VGDDPVDDLRFFDKRDDSHLALALGAEHKSFNVHSKVRAKTKKDTERVGKYMIRPILSLRSLSFDETEGRSQSLPPSYHLGRRPPCALQRLTP